MALPFVLGLIIGGGAVYAYNNREQLAKKLSNTDLKAGLKSGEKKLRNVSNALKAGAKTTLENLKGEEIQAPKRTRAKSANANLKSDEAKTAPKRTRAKATGVKRTRKAQNTQNTQNTQIIAQTQNLPQNLAQNTPNPSVDAQ
ncbi:hypothetical protein [Helicobacter sp. 23-1045]